jgi:hypothetical protein
MRHKKYTRLLILTVVSVSLFGCNRPLNGINIRDITPYPTRPPFIPTNVAPIPETESPTVTDSIPPVAATDDLTETAIFSSSSATSAASTLEALSATTPPSLPTFTPTKKNTGPGATQVPPTQVPPTQVPPTQVPPTQVPPTQVPPTQGNNLVLKVKDSNYTCKNNEAKVKISLSATGGTNPYNFYPSKNFFFTYPANQSASLYVEVRDGKGNADAKEIKFSPCIQ